MKTSLIAIAAAATLATLAAPARADHRIVAGGCDRLAEPPVCRTRVIPATGSSAPGVCACPAAGSGRTGR